MLQRIKSLVLRFSAKKPVTEQEVWEALWENVGLDIQELHEPLRVPEHQIQAILHKLLQEQRVTVNVMQIHRKDVQLFRKAPRVA